MDTSLPREDDPPSEQEVIHQRAKVAMTKGEPCECSLLIAERDKLRSDLAESRASNKREAREFAAKELDNAAQKLPMIRFEAQQIWLQQRAASLRAQKDEQ